MFQLQSILLNVSLFKRNKIFKENLIIYKYMDVKIDSNLGQTGHVVVILQNVQLT